MKTLFFRFVTFLFFGAMLCSLDVDFSIFVSSLENDSGITVVERLGGQRQY